MPIATYLKAHMLQTVRSCNVSTDAPTRLHSDPVEVSHLAMNMDGLIRHKLKKLAPSPHQLKWRRIHSLLVLACKLHIITIQ